MDSTHIINGNDNGSEPITNPHIHIASTPKNSHSYSFFDMHLVSNYTNNQLIYYYISDAISATEQPWFQQLMKQHKISLDLLSWNDASDENNNLREDSEDSHISENDSDSDCSASLQDYKSIKINFLDIFKLLYNSFLPAVRRSFWCL